jgi:acrylyl-CoA reductase (NADPH)
MPVLHACRAVEPMDNLAQPAPVPRAFSALRSAATEGVVRSAVQAVQLDDLSAGELTVRVQWAGVNYKDSLAVTGAARIFDSLPRIAGIELVGTVVASSETRFRPGDAVLVHGFRTGIAFDGGFAQWARVPAAHAMHVPAGLTPWQAAVLGVPGFTVAMALAGFEALGLRPQTGEVAVSGAGGAVGMLAVAILSRAGYRVVALSRTREREAALRALGAQAVLTTEACAGAGRPLEREQFAAAIDNVGGEVLSWLMRSMAMDGRLAVVGNASGIGFAANVLPFVMRNLRMFGVVANADWPTRQALWSRLADDWRPDFDALGPHVHEIGLPALLAHCEAQVGGRTSGRTLLSFAEEAG